MTPRFAGLYRANVAAAYAVLTSKFIGGRFGKSDGKNVLGRQSASSVLLAASAASATFIGTVRHVLGLSAHKKMFKADAGWVVAAMTSKLFGQNRNARRFQNKVRNTPHFAGVLHDSVAISLRAVPLNAPSRGVHRPVGNSLFKRPIWTRTGNSHCNPDYAIAAGGVP